MSKLDLRSNLIKSNGSNSVKGPYFLQTTMWSTEVLTQKTRKFNGELHHLTSATTQEEVSTAKYTCHLATRMSW